MNTCAQLFIDDLKAKDFNFDVHEPEADLTIVSLPFSGKTVNIFFNGENGTYLSLYMKYESIPEEKLVDVIIACNELNTEYKWATFYVDKDRDLMIHDDAILSVGNAAAEAFEIMARIIKIADDVKPTIMKAIYA